MANSFVRYTGDNSTTSYSIPFSYRTTGDLTITLAGSATTAYSLNAAGTTLTFNTAPASGVAIEIRRTTSQTTRLTDYASGSVLTENDLDTDSEQAFFMSQEAIDDAGDVIKIDNTNFQWDTQNKRLTNVADPVDNTDGVNKQFISTNLPNITTVSGISADVTTVAGISADVTSVANDATDIGLVATNIGSVNTVAADITKVIAVANDLAEAVSEVETVANDLNEATSEIDTVANAITNVDTVGTNIANVNTVAGIDANVTTVAGISADVTSVAGISTAVTNVNSNSTNINAVNTNSANINTVAGIDTDVTSVAGISSAVSAVNSNSTNINAVNANSTNINTVAGNNTNINTVATNNANITSVAGVSANVTTVAGISANVTAVAGIASDVSAVENIASNVTSVAGVASSVTTVAGISSDVTTVANIASDVSAVENIASDVTTVGGSIANVNTVATNIAGVNSFANQYRVNSSDPSSSLDAGDLAYNTTGNVLKFYNGSAWVAITSGGITDLAQDSTPQLGGNLDLNSNNITGTGGIPSANLTGSIAEARLPASALGAIWESKSANFTTEIRKNYFIDTTSNTVSATLPSSATAGDEIHFLDVSGTFDTNNLTILRNSHKIQGATSDLTVATERAGLTLVYLNATQGWLLKNV